MPCIKDVLLKTEAILYHLTEVLINFPQSCQNITFCHLGLQKMSCLDQLFLLPNLCPVFLSQMYLNSSHIP